MRFAAAASILTLVLAPAFAQNAASVPQSPAPKPQDLCTLEGVVVNAITGEGLRKIEVSANQLGPNRFSAATVPQGGLTDATGHFVISGLAPGRYTLVASGNGYAWQVYGPYRGRGGATILTLVAGSHEKNITFRLMPPGVITGSVYDEDGDPAVNAWVSATRVTEIGYRRRRLSSSGAQTNDLGQYRLFGLEPGQYLVSAGRQNASGTTDAGDAVYVPTFYPGTADPEQAGTVRLQPGDEVSGIDISLQKVHAVSVRGRVTSADPSQSLVGAWVQLISRNNSGVRGFSPAVQGGTVGSDRGDFEIRGVSPGSYTLVVNWNARDRAVSGQTPLEVGSADVEGITVTVGTGVELAGRFQIDPGGTLTPAQLNLWLNPSNGGVGGSAGAQVKPDGTFTIPNVMGGVYRVRVSGFPEEYYVKWARLGGVDVMGSGLTISQSQPPGQLEIGLSLDGGRLDGVVLKDQRPFPGAQVVLVPDPPNRDRDDLYDFKNSDALGRFSLVGLPPGDYKLFAWEPREGLPLNDPDFIKDYEKHGAPVHVETKKQQYVQVEVIPAEEKNAANSE